MEIIYFIFVSVMLLRIAYIDFKEHYIYDLDIGIIAFVILAYNIYLSNWKCACIGGVIGFVIGYVIYVASYYAYQEEAFGFGDVLLLGALGLLFGYPTFFHYFAITIMATGIVAAGFILWDSKYRKMELPMAPVFVLGAISFILLDYPCIEEAVYWIHYGISIGFNVIMNLF